MIRALMWVVGAGIVGGILGFSCQWAFGPLGYIISIPAALGIGIAGGAMAVEELSK